MPPDSEDRESTPYPSVSPAEAPVLSEFASGRIKARNRLAFTATGNNLGTNREATPAQVGFYEDRAQGGVGIITTEALCVAPAVGCGVSASCNHPKSGGSHHQRRTLASAGGREPRLGLCLARKTGSCATVLLREGPAIPLLISSVRDGCAMVLVGVRGPRGCSESLEPASGIPASPSVHGRSGGLLQRARQDSNL